MNLSHSARLLFIGLITQADDHGKGSADPRRLKAVIFGGDDVTMTDVRGWLVEVATQKLAVLYTADGFGDLYYLPSWELHQYVQKPQNSRYPDPNNELLPERYRNGNGPLPGDWMDRKDRKGSEGATGTRRAPKARASGAPPDEELTPEQVRARQKAIEENKKTLARAMGTASRGLPQ